MSLHSAPASAIRKGRNPAKSTAANAPPARTTVGRGNERATSMSTKKGTATRANCLRRIAAASATAAQTKRDRVTSANANSSARIAVASAVPNQAPRTRSGLAATALPITSRHGSGASKRRTAKKQPIVASRTSTR